VHFEAVERGHPVEAPIPGHYRVCLISAGQRAERRQADVAIKLREMTNGAEALDPFIQVTTPANSLISGIIDRMPATPSRERATWLCETEAHLRI
jgi:hypothetical protein